MFVFKLQQTKIPDMSLLIGAEINAQKRLKAANVAI